MPDLKFERSQENWRFLFKGQNMPYGMILVFRKHGMHCFASQKRCALSYFKDRKRLTFFSEVGKGGKVSF